MVKARYSNAFVQSTPIMLGNPAAQFGVLLSEYDVREYYDLRTSMQGAAPMRAYIVTLKQRLTLFNSTAAGFGGQYPPTAYSGYPALAVQMVSPTTSAQSLQFYLEDYSPKTLNAAVNTSQNQGTNSSQSSSVQHTAGSSTSETNSYEVSGSIGFFGMDPTGSVGGGFSHSKTTTTESSATDALGQERGFQSGSASSMSVKDWACYAFLDNLKQQPSWVWGQEYPWNVIDFRNSTDDTTTGSTTIDLPTYVQELLCDGSYLFPPSHIAQFGLNFVAHAKWTFYVQGPAGAEDETVNFAHSLTYWEGSHSSTGTSPALSLTASLAPIAINVPVETLTLDLPVLSLDPISSAGTGNGAVIGFVQSEFITPAGPTAFRLKSGANNLYVSQGTGFDTLTNDDSILTASNISAQSPAQLTIQFKVIDPALELSLYFKHWITTSTGCVMTLVVNGQSITRHIDAMNAGSGTDNITTVTLRSQDYTDPEYYDYLVMGLNTILVTITPTDGNQPAGYVLRALAIQ